MDGWSGIWNRQRNTNGGSRLPGLPREAVNPRPESWLPRLPTRRLSPVGAWEGAGSRKEVGHPPVGMAGALEEEREVY